MSSSRQENNVQPMSNSANKRPRMSVFDRLSFSNSSNSTTSNNNSTNHSSLENNNLFREYNHNYNRYERENPGSSSADANWRESRNRTQRLYNQPPQPVIQSDNAPSIQQRRPRIVRPAATPYTPPNIRRQQSQDLPNLSEETRIRWNLEELTSVRQSAEKDRITFIRETLRQRWALSCAELMSYQVEEERMFPTLNSLEEFIRARPHFFEESNGKLSNRPLWYSKLVIWTVIFIMEKSNSSSDWISMNQLFVNLFPFLPLYSIHVDFSDELITIPLNTDLGKKEAVQLYQSLPAIFECDGQEFIRIRNIVSQIPSIWSDFCVQKKEDEVSFLDRSRILHFRAVWIHHEKLGLQRTEKMKSFKLRIIDGIYKNRLVFVYVLSDDGDNLEATEQIALIIRNCPLSGLRIEGQMVHAFNSKNDYQFMVESLILYDDEVSLWEDRIKIELKQLISGPEKRKGRRMEDLLPIEKTERRNRELDENVRKEKEWMAALEKIVTKNGITIKEILTQEISELPRTSEKLVAFFERRNHLFVLEREEEDFDQFKVKKQTDQMHKAYITLAEIMSSDPNSWSREKLQNSILLNGLDTILNGTSMMVYEGMYYFKLQYNQEEKIFVNKPRFTLLTE